nr:SDR family NAD(P)-dependent oxidoreductase [Vibrio cyclitrophicus]
MSLNKLNLEQAKVEINTLFPSCNVEVVPIDFNVPSEVETTITSIINHQSSIIKKHKNIEVMVNSTGILAAGNTKLPLVKLSELMNVNLLSTITACNIVAEQMKKQGFGEIYNIGSTAGLTPVPKIAAYAASKAAIISYSESLYHELLPFGVKVCCLCPSVVNTDMTNDGRIDNKLKIETQDLTKALDFIRSLSSAATVSTLSIRCRIIDLE